MKHLTGFLATVLLLSSSIVNGHGNGLIGYGQWWYDPECAYSCRAVISSAPLDCPGMDHDAIGMHHGASPMAPCISQNGDFLRTLAYCISQQCDPEKVSVSRIEAYWADQATGDPALHAKWTYGATLANITQAPTRVFQTGDMLNYTALLSDEDYDYQSSFNKHFDWEEMIQSTYVIVIITVGVGTPVLISLISRLPYMTGVSDKLKPYLVYPSTIGTYSVRTLPYMLGNAPTMGQGLYIAMFVILNIVLGSITYKNFSHAHPWGFTKSGEILAYVGYRTGHISFALLPLTVLFSSRNNFLLWLTNWPYSTFIVLHRWVARLCAIHAVVHSITLLINYEETGSYYKDVHKPYWIWGIVATLCLVIILFQSVVWLRRASYEIFLVLHILFAVFTVVGCWYHVYYWKGFTGIYELWIYMVSAVWFFDRLMRVMRIAKNGIRRATVTEISSDTVRVDIEGLRWSPTPGQHAYVYFPTLQPLRGWENHPFSIAHTALLRSRQHSLPSPGESLQGDLSEAKDIESAKKSPPVTVSDPSFGTDSITIYIKKHTGMTSYLRNHIDLPVLLEGPYRGNPSDALLKCDRILLIGGGIGITGLLNWTQAHTNVKLAWSVRQSAEHVVRDLAPALGNVSDKEVLVGQRLDIDGLLAREVQSDWKRVGVLVCGPPDLCDAVRASVVTFARREDTVFELEVDAFSW